MHVYQNEVITWIKNTLQADDQFSYVGEFPDDIDRFGRNLPAVLVQDGDQPEYVMMSGGQLRYTYEVNVWLYHRPGQNRVITMNVLTDLVIDKILSSPGIADYVFNLEAVSVEKGEAHGETTDYLAPGIYNNLTIRKIGFRMQILDTRSDA